MSVPDLTVGGADGARDTHHAGATHAGRGATHAGPPTHAAATHRQRKPTTSPVVLSRAVTHSMAVSLMGHQADSVSLGLLETPDTICISPLYVIFSRNREADQRPTALGRVYQLVGSRLLDAVISLAVPAEEIVHEDAT